MKIINFPIKEISEQTERDNATEVDVSSLSHQEIADVLSLLLEVLGIRLLQTEEEFLIEED